MDIPTCELIARLRYVCKGGKSCHVLDTECHSDVVSCSATFAQKATFTVLQCRSETQHNLPLTSGNRSSVVGRWTEHQKGNVAVRLSEILEI